MRAPGSSFLIVMAILASAILLLGYVPWSRPGTLWRPVRVEEAQHASRYWDETTLEKGRDFRSNGYTRYFRRKGLVGLLLVVLVASGAHLWLRKLPGGTGILPATIAILLVLLLLDCLALPFGLWGLKDARAYGISTQSVGFWLADRYKGLAISLALSAVVAAGLLFLMHRLPRAWPLPATALVGIGAIVMALAVPLVIDPIFNKFTPLADASLKSRFLELARQGGVPAREVLVSDASRRTTAVNAYFTGFGPTRRIVVYDTLVESLEPDEAGLVVAHEVGHWSHGHIMQGILYAVLGTGLGLLLAAVFMSRIFRDRLFGIDGPLDPAGAPLLVLLYWFGTFAALPIENGISRKMEIQADRFALDLTGDAATQIRAETRITTKNLGDVIPPPFVKIMFHTHPSPLERVAQAERYAASARPDPEARTP